MATRIKDLSAETQLMTRPQKFAAAQPSKLLTPVDAPPLNVGRGRRRNPIYTALYAQLLENRNQWFHVNIAFTTKKEAYNLSNSLYNRALKDSLSLSRSTAFNEKTKTWDLWVMLGR